MNKKIEELYNKIDGLNNIIDLQTLEIARLKEESMNDILEGELDLLDSDMTASITNTLKNGKEFVLYSPKYVNKLENKIDKSIEYIKNNWYSKNTRNIEELHSLGDWRLDLLEILGDKENE